MTNNNNLLTHADYANQIFCYLPVRYVSKLRLCKQLEQVVNQFYATRVPRFEICTVLDIGFVLENVKYLPNTWISVEELPRVTPCEMVKQLYQHVHESARAVCEPMPKMKILRDTYCFSYDDASDVYKKWSDYLDECPELEQLYVSRDYYY